jgi:4-amino-4-deoxy-L-arabinose transferase-like glycosyltransferase
MIFKKNWFFLIFIFFEFSNLSGAYFLWLVAHLALVAHIAICATHRQTMRGAF